MLSLLVMIRQKFKLHKYDWTVTCYYVVTSYWVNDIMNELERIGCSGEILHNAYEQLVLSDLDSGLTYSNKERGATVMVIDKTTSAEEFMKSWTHEMGHLKDHIATAYGISPHGEEIQYLGDEIISEMWDVAHNFVCCECREKLNLRCK